MPTTESVPIDTLTPHPLNPRIGNVAMIAESLKAHGQYRPIVAHEQTRHIIAGTHTWKAAKALGWKAMDVTWFTGSDEDAIRVLLADNRTGDLASIDHDALLKMLGALPDFAGTGFSIEDVDSMDTSYASKPPKPKPKTPEGVKVRFGPFTGHVDVDVFGAWNASVSAEHKTRKAVMAHIVIRLGLDSGPIAGKAASKEQDKAPEVSDADERRTIRSAESVPLSALILYPGNPRQGDIGAICESLIVNGQYRPIVASRRTRRILVGNHTAQAIQALGWQEIAVVWIDVDEETERRIVIMDNRSSDAATYDTEALLQSIAELPGLLGTGWDSEDLSSLGDTGIPGPARTRAARIEVGPYRCRIPLEDFEQWTRRLPLGSELQEALTRIELPIEGLLEAP